MPPYSSEPPLPPPAFSDQEERILSLIHSLWKLFLFRYYTNDASLLINSVIGLLSQDSKPTLTLLHLFRTLLIVIDLLGETLTRVLQPSTDGVTFHLKAPCTHSDLCLSTLCRQTFVDFMSVDRNRLVERRKEWDLAHLPTPPVDCYYLSLTSYNVGFYGDTCNSIVPCTVTDFSRTTVS
ncbi:hypothetical protein AVEN_179927-1 [Araneus ventricosus]|uniref:Uncharacterized protein n=1 Tax=Araneus ventricosus TaxID=182803 RepID=A0A4Y2MJH9_ARAVE|nr:hypothetical protein AVEN_12209-1 [Araneus ventricosus]GBN25917.1 hypothetical protein AVEN_112546-1 [Araneus ventricosus]GBN25931.1 hypothetical protein AVEN_137699-1 [Araneus ventricosus]GBN25948.1 hypothetical protein AVEN_179927-1 [Araneus ventricosus]